ncbi:hypothetical protein COCNU_04G009540 [Cocos nucifera]|uniref:Uncharacterized protein n=1 Tax=Cocos nucifera TaxID=13894 RepID=A0A8K0I617_COCNU|nr:hypothetical protein COCNU_04G009540 [Cocos nucifera]
MSVPIERPPNQRQEKAPVTSARSEAPTGLAKFVNIQILVGESVLTNPAMVKQLIKAILLLVDRQSRRSWTLADIFSSFYSLISVAHDVSALDRGFGAYANVRQGWSDKMKKVIVEKNAALKHLHAAVDREGEAKEWEEKLAEEVSHLKAKLESAFIDFGSANLELESVHSELTSARFELELAQVDCESAD